MRSSRLFAALFSIAVFATPILMAQNSPKTKNLQYLGKTTLTATSPNTGAGIDHLISGPEVDMNFSKPLLSGTIAPARVPASHVPRPAGSAITSSTPEMAFYGLDNYLQATAPTGYPGGLQGTVEPPDQGLAVGSGWVVEAVNDALAVYTTGGTYMGRAAISYIFQQPPPLYTVGQNLFSGPLLSDPRVYYDADTGRFFMTVVMISADPATGRLQAPTYELIAVSDVGNPFVWAVYGLNTTNDGDPALGTCPCFGDQPLLGADQNAIFVSTNAFSITDGFRGAQIYAVSKNSLATAASTIPVVHFSGLVAGEGYGYSIQPSFVPPNGGYATANGGTEYLMSALDYTGTLDNRLALWAITNTGSIDSGTPDLHISYTLIGTQVYGQPPSAQQKPGPTPLADYLASPQSPYGIFRNHEELVASNDDRMQQVIYADGKLWTSLTTVVQTGGPVRSGAAWFVVSPSSTATTVSGSIVNQGYVAINSPMQNNVIFPSIAVNANGKAAICFSVVGRDYYPSAAYAMLSASTGTGPIVISAAGPAPDDGFSGYAPFAFRVGRWGDYSAGTADENGNLWLANELIPPTRLTTYANWGTYIVQLPHD